MAFVLLPGVSQGVRRGNDPEAKVDGKPSVLVVVGVAVEGGAVTAQDVFQSPVREVPPL